MIDFIDDSDGYDAEGDLNSPQSSCGEVKKGETRLQQLTASWQSYRPIIERRQFPRLKYSAPIQIVPINDATDQPREVIMEATGRDLSEQGISFIHTQNIPEQRVLICLGQGEVTKVYQVNLRWSRYRGNQTWMSGGYFERTYTADDARWQEIEQCFSRTLN